MKIILYKECWHTRRNGSQYKQLHQLGMAMVPDESIDTAKLVMQANPAMIFRNIPNVPPELANVKFKSFVTSEMFKDEVMMICE